MLVPVFLVMLTRGDPARFIRRIFPFDYRDQITQAAKEYGLEPLFVASVIKAESSFFPHADSGRAKGLMQLTDDTAAFIAEKTGLSYEQRTLPLTNIRMGCFYLSYLGKHFGSMELMLAAYNAGPARVSGWLSDSRYCKDGSTLDKIPYAETRKYTHRVSVYYRIYKFLYK